MLTLAHSRPSPADMSLPELWTALQAADRDEQAAMDRQDRAETFSADYRAADLDCDDARARQDVMLAELRRQTRVLLGGVDMHELAERLA